MEDGEARGDERAEIARERLQCAQVVLGGGVGFRGESADGGEQAFMRLLCAGEVARGVEREAAHGGISVFDGVGKLIEPGCGRFARSAHHAEDHGANRSGLAG